MGKNNKKITFHTFEIVDKFLFFSALNCNGLYKMRIGDNQAEFVGTFPKEKLDIRHLHGATKLFEGKLYFAPYFGNCLSIFDIYEEKFTSIDLTPYVGNIIGKYYGVQIHNRKVILVPSRAKEIIVYDIDNERIECHSEWLKSVDLSVSESIPPMKNGSFISEDKLYIPYGKYAAILEIDLNNFVTKSIEFGDIDCGFVDAIYDSEKKNVYLLANGKGSIFELQLSTMEIIKYDSNEKFNNIDFPFIKMIDTPNSLLLVMYQAEYNLLFDKSTHLFEKIKIDVINWNSPKEWNANFYSAQRLSSDEILMMATGDYQIYVIDNLGCLKRKFTLEDDLKVIRLMRNQNKILISEKKDMDLEDFIHYVVHK